MAIRLVEACQETVKTPNCVAPVIHPTLQTGVETLVVAAQAWFSAQRTIH